MVGFVESGGARLQEGHAALAGTGGVFRDSVELSTRVPQVSIVSGVSAGGGAYAPALTDFVLMTEQARMLLTGPQVVREALGEDVSMEDLGDGPRVHGATGVCQLHVRRRGGGRRNGPRAPLLPSRWRSATRPRGSSISRPPEARRPGPAGLPPTAVRYPGHAR